ncbi:unnamed protein product [Closterium sp. NIES-54]
MELQEAAEEEGEGEAEAVGEALAEGETECFSRPEGWAPPCMKPPSGERARGGAVQGSGAQGDGAQGKANPGMFLMVEDVKGSEGDVGSVGKVVKHPLTHWVIDSGCTSHMTPRADLLDEVKPPGKIKFVATTSGALLPVIGVGNAKVMGANGGLVGLGNVLLVEGLSANLLSVRRLQKSKAKVSFGPTSCRAKLGKLLLWDLKEKSSCIKDLWQLPIIPWNGKPPATAAAAATAKKTSGGEETAPTDGALDAVKKVQQSQQPHGESGHKVKVIRTDNGGEFIGADFESVLKKKGIQHQLTVPYNPQQNGVAERFNRTLQEGARTLLGRAGLPDPFWVTALRQVALVKNRELATVGDKQQVQVTVSDEEISGVTEDGGEPEVEEQQQQQDAPQGAARPADRPRRDVRPPNRLTYPSFGKPKVVRAGSVAEQCDEEEIADCYWAVVPEPKTLAEALSGPDAEKWKQSVKEEYDSLLENETWELCELPPGKKTISSKLIFRHKYGPDGELTSYKSRLVAKGFQQTKGKDFDEIFAPVGKGTTLRLEGLDDGSGKVCRLKKAIYGLKQAPRAWYHKLEETLLAGGFKKSECDHSLFLLQEKEQFLMLLVYVDDILLFSKSSAMIERVEEMLEMQFKCSKMGDVKYYLGMHVERDLDKGVLRLHQRKYCEGLS